MKRIFTYIFILSGLFILLPESVAETVMPSAPRNRVLKQRLTLPQDSPLIPFILVEFSDVPFTIPSPAEVFAEAMNGEDYSGYGASGSVRKWFADNSRGLYTPAFEVIGPIMADQPSAYYGMNNVYGKDMRAHELAAEVSRKAAELTDLSRFDNDGDGVVDLTYICYSGQGESTYGGATTIWPSNGSLAEDGLSVEAGGVAVDHYAMTNEWDRVSPTGIGTYIYQLLLSIGLSPLNEPFDRTLCSSPLSWDIMDTGYNNDTGMTPPCLSSVERMALGWLEPTEVAPESEVTLKDLAQSNTAIKIPAGSNENEYFLLEYRAMKGWDSYLPHHGLLIWHVDYDAEAWATGTVNVDPAHHRVRLIKANNVEVVATNGSSAHTVLPGWCFPGKEEVTAIGNHTVPALKSWSDEPTPYPLSDITEHSRGDYVRFFVGDISLTKVPVAVAPVGDQVGTDSFTALWGPVKGADEYIVSVYLGTPQEIGEAVCDFGVTPGFQMPYGWDTSSTATYTSAAYCGESSPALRFRDEGAYLVSPVLPSPINHFSFWARDISGEKSLVTVTGRDTANRSYSLGQFTPEQEGHIYTYDTVLEGKDIRRVKVLYQRQSGSMSIDDLVIRYGELPVPCPGYEEVTVSGETSLTVENIEEYGRDFYYTVRSVSDGYVSAASAPVTVHLGTTGVEAVGAKTEYTLEGTQLRSDHLVSVYTAGGLLVGTGTELTLPGAGVYVLVCRDGSNPCPDVQKIVVGVK